MPYIEIEGLGRVEVIKLPKRIPKTVMLFGIAHTVDKERYKLVWARKYGTARARKKIMKVM